MHSRLFVSFYALRLTCQIDGRMTPKHGVILLLHVAWIDTKTSRKGWVITLHTTCRVKARLYVHLFAKVSSPYNANACSDVKRLNVLLWQALHLGMLSPHNSVRLGWLFILLLFHFFAEVVFTTCFEGQVEVVRNSVFCSLRLHY